MNKSQMGQQIRYLDSVLKECEAENDKLSEALKRISRLRVDGPSPLGPLHAAGMSHGFDVCRQIAEEALTPITSTSGANGG